MTNYDDRDHIARELDFQITRVWSALGDLPPHGGLGYGTLKFEELADAAKRASDALRAMKVSYTTSSNYSRSHEMGWHAADTGE